MTRSGWDREGRTRMLALALALLVPAGCWADSEPAAPHEDEAITVDGEGLADLLRSRGAVVRETGERVAFLFTVPGEVLLVNGARVLVYPFADEAAARSEVPALRNSLILWAEPVRLYRRGRLLVLYAGGNESVIRVLERALGAPVSTVP